MERRKKHNKTKSKTDKINNLKKTNKKNCIENNNKSIKVGKDISNYKHITKIKNTQKKNKIL